MLFLCEKPCCDIHTQARVSFANFCISIVQLTATNFRDWFWDQTWNNKAAISCQSLNILDVRPEPFQFPSNFGAKWYFKYNPDGHLGSQPKLVLSCSKVPCFQLVFQIKSRLSFDSPQKLVLQANEIHLKIFDFQISWAFFNTRSVNSNTQLALEKFL